MPLGDTVGAVYVRVLADTSRLKSAIEREGEEDGEAFGDEFDKSLAKRLNKIQFDKVLSVRLEKEAKRMAKRIQTAGTGGDVEFKISKKFEDEVRHLSELFDVPLNEVETMVSNRLSAAFDRSLDNMGRSVKKKKAHIGDALDDVFKDLSFDAAIQNLTDQVAKKIPPSVRKAIEKGQKDVKWTFTASLLPELQRLSKEWGFTVEELEQEIKRRIPAAYKQAGKDAGKAAKTVGKAVNRSLLDALDDVNFQTVVKKAAKDFEEYLTPAMKKSLEKGQQVDFTWDDKARKELKKLARSMNVSVKDMSRGINHLMQDTFKKVDEPISRFDRGMVRVRNSLRRAGTGGWFDNLTNSLSGMLGIGLAFGKVMSKAFIAVGKGAGKFFSFVGDGLTSLAAKGGKLAGVLGKAGLISGRLGALLSKLGGPIGMVVGAIVTLLGTLFVLYKGLGAVVTLIVDLAGVVAMLATGFVAAAAASAVLVPIIVSLGAGLAGMAIGALDAAGALAVWAKRESETDPKKRAELLEKYNEQMKKLGPNARAAVEAFKPLVKQFAGLKKSAGEALFDGMASALKKSTPLVDALKAGLTLAAGAVGNVIDQFLRLGSNEQFMESFTALWEFAAVAIRDVGSAFVDIFAGLTSFFAAIIPQATEFTGWIRGIAESFRLWAEGDAGREQIKTWFIDAWGVAKGLWDVIDSLTGAVWAFFSALITGPEGLETTGFFTDIAGALDRLKEKIEEMDKNGTLQRWLGRARETAAQLWDGLKALWDLFKEINTEENHQFLLDMIGAAKTLIGWLKNVISWAKTAKTWFDKLRNVDNAVANFILPKLGRGAEGGMFSSATPMIIGEAGREALIPLDRPLSRIDPSVRSMAAQLRGVGGDTTSTKSEARREITNNWNISSPTGDPFAIAAQVMNREVSMAG